MFFVSLKWVLLGVVLITSNFFNIPYTELVIWCRMKQYFREQHHINQCQYKTQHHNCLLLVFIPSVWQLLTLSQAVKQLFIDVFLVEQIFLQTNTFKQEHTVLRWRDANKIFTVPTRILFEIQSRIIYFKANLALKMIW